MNPRQETIPAKAKARLTEALDRLVQLYEAKDNPARNAAEAERYRKELAARKAAEKAPKK